MSEVVDFLRDVDEEHVMRLKNIAESLRRLDPLSVH
jgi:hypothetical protein